MRVDGDLLALAAGTIVTGFDGTSLDAPVRGALGRVPFAGFILFARNLIDVTQARALTDELRALQRYAPLLCIDQEGGRVARLTAGVEVMPPMMALGATGDPDLAAACGEQLAHDLRRAGCNLDFAPVLDLAVDPRNTVIGTRAFGASTQLVSTLGLSLARSMQAAGVVPVVKHFPGHGATASDTHLGPARLDADAATLESRDLLPFEAACDARLPAVMAAHVAVPAIDGDTPASMSAAMIGGILRERFRYRGVVFTDCMQMDAIACGVGTVHGVTAAIAAGADCALVSHDPQLAYEAAVHLAWAVDRGALSRARLEEAHARVQRMRAALAPAVALEAPPPHPGIGSRIAAAAVTLVRGTLPVSPERSVALTYRAHVDESEARRVEAQLEKDPDTVVVSTGEPFDLDRFPSARTLVACYSSEEPMRSALRAALYGGTPCTGRLPI